MLRRCGGPVHRRSYSRGSVMARPGFGWGGPFTLDKVQVSCYLRTMKTTTTREGTMINHGTVLVHSITGEPRNLLQEVSVPRDSTPPQGFKYSSGWMDKDGNKFNLYTKELPLN